MAADELVGEAPQGWEYTTLGAVCEQGGGNIQTGPFGSQLHASDYVLAGIPSIMPENIGDNRIIEDGIARITSGDAKRLGRYLVQEGDIIYSRRGDVERCALVTENEEGWLCGTGCLRIRLGKNGVDPRYTIFYLRHLSVRGWIVRHAHGATMPNLNTSILAACPFLVPPPTDQQAIGHILGTLDDKIELNRRMNETLEAMARALFKSWFVDFDPARNEVNDEQRMPPGWKLCPLREIADVLSGGTPSRDVPNYWGGTIPWVSPKAMRSIHIDQTEERVTEAAIGNGTRLVPRGTVLVMVRGMGLHQGVRISQTQCDVTFNQDVKALVPRGCDGVLLLFAMLDAAPRLLAKVRAAGHGTGVLPTEALDELLFPIPPLHLADRLKQPLSVLNLKIAANNREANTLADLRDALLPKLISGEIRLREAETLIEKVV